MIAPDGHCDRFVVRYSLVATSIAIATVFELGGSSEPARTSKASYGANNCCQHVNPHENSGFFHPTDLSPKLQATSGRQTVVACG